MARARPGNAHFLSRSVRACGLDLMPFGNSTPNRKPMKWLRNPESLAIRLNDAPQGESIGVGRAAVPLPLTPNRTGGSPASGFPVRGRSCEGERIFASSPSPSGVPSVGPKLLAPGSVHRGTALTGTRAGLLFHQSAPRTSTFLRALRSTVVTHFFATTDALTPASQVRGRLAQRTL